MCLCNSSRFANSRVQTYVDPENAPQSALVLLHLPRRGAIWLGGMLSMALCLVMFDFIGFLPGFISLSIHLLFPFFNAR